jgi:hypothetical protein
MHIGLIGAAAGASSASTQKRITQQLRDIGATRRDTAQPLPEIASRHRRMVDRLIARGIVRQAQPGTYYLDEQTLAEARARACRVAWVVAVVGAGFVALMALAG